MSTRTDQLHVDKARRRVIPLRNGLFVVPRTGPITHTLVARSWLHSKPLVEPVHLIVAFLGVILTALLACRRRVCLESKHGSHSSIER